MTILKRHILKRTLKKVNAENENLKMTVQTRKNLDNDNSEKEKSEKLISDKPVKGTYETGQIWKGEI